MRWAAQRDIADKIMDKKVDYVIAARNSNDRGEQHG
jgi:hypothetical protein